MSPPGRPVFKTGPVWCPVGSRWNDRAQSPDWQDALSCFFPLSLSTALCCKHKPAAASPFHEWRRSVTPQSSFSVLAAADLVVSPSPFSINQTY